MPSKKKIEANKKNAQKSTGPKTKEGKKVSSQNGVKHGLYAKAIIVNSPYLKESKKEYLDLVEAMFEELAPEGVFQQQLVFKIANCLWRQRRVIRAETAHINDQLDDIDENKIYRWERNWGGYDVDDPESMEQLEEDVERIVENRIGISSIPNDDHARNILRYEMRLDRQITRAYRLLSLAKQEARLKHQRENQPLVGQYPSSNAAIPPQESQSPVGQEPSPSPATNRQERVPDGAESRLFDTEEFIGRRFTGLDDIPTIDELQSSVGQEPSSSSATNRQERRNASTEDARSET